MATLATTAVTRPGATVSTSAAGASGDAFLSGEHVFFLVSNTSGSSRTVTFASQQACSDGATHNDPITVADATKKVIGPFPRRRWGDASGLVQVTYSANAGLAVGAFRIDPENA